MAWWQAILIFVAIPGALFAVITVVVLLTSHPRVPDGIAAAAKAEANSDPSRPNDEQEAT